MVEKTCCHTELELQLTLLKLLTVSASLEGLTLVQYKSVRLLLLSLLTFTAMQGLVYTIPNETKYLQPHNSCKRKNILTLNIEIHGFSSQVKMLYFYLQCYLGAEPLN